MIMLLQVYIETPYYQCMIALKPILIPRESHVLFEQNIHVRSLFPLFTSLRHIHIPLKCIPIYPR